ncbi:hypothetical protein HRG_004066 [Hirsutella rhossiliensis]|uniref:Uncharacterized protein n=1 Tax=Hirsutella rhossiliensis TaxID=111463 RepID=A0A9P8SLR1_9HYPO|nr:uncharacterized protein HRG_04066 [Hirsutella rhossiliensis]KAH0966050.1 hypothetical protein HRG_04066 [Hirsutella rhossiliensis]
MGFHDPTTPVDGRIGDREISEAEKSKQAREVGDALEVRQPGDGNTNELRPRSILTLSHGIVNEFTTFLPYLTTSTADPARPPSAGPPLPMARTSRGSDDLLLQSTAAITTPDLLAQPTSLSAESSSVANATASRENGGMPTPKADQQSAMGALSQNNINRGVAVGIAAAGVRL